MQDDENGFNWEAFQVFEDNGELTNKDLDNNAETQKLNEYHWHPVSNIQTKEEFDNHIAKLKAMQKFNRGER